jgi:hypothetical protein
MITLPSKYDGENIVIPFDFAPGLDAGETIIGIVSVVSSLNSGGGAVAIGTTQISGSMILAPVTGGVSGSSYVIKAIADTSNVNKRLEIVALLPVA